MNPENEFEFSVDASYENEKGPFRVLSIDRGDMLIRWEKSGEEAHTSVELQGRIQQRRMWEKQRQEQLAAAAKPAPAKPKAASKKEPPKGSPNPPLKVTDPITLRMIRAGMVAIAHFTIRTSMEMNGIRMSVTTTLP